MKLKVVLEVIYPVIEHKDRADIDMNLFAEKMLYLMQNPPKRKRMGENARKRYEKLYSSEVFHENMLGFYLSLI
jgi:glycosyltransferase involved in cell wall biosynthesis